MSLSHSNWKICQWDDAHRLLRCCLAYFSDCNLNALLWSSLWKIDGTVRCILGDANVQASHFSLHYSLKQCSGVAKAVFTSFPGRLATAKNKRMLPAQLSVQAGGFRDNSLHWWRPSSNTRVIGCGNIAVLGRRVIMAELRALDCRNSSYYRASVLYKVPSVLYILNYLIFTFLSHGSYLYATFQWRKLRHSSAQDCIAGAQF